MKHSIIIGISLLVLLSACRTGTGEEENIDRLLETQAELEEAQEESVEQLERIKDSLAAEEKTLMEQRETTEERIGEMERSRQMLAEQLKEEELADVAADTAALREQIDRYNDSIAELKSEVSGLDARLDSIQQGLSFYNMQENRTEQTLESGIREIDQRMTSRENRKEQEMERIDLLEKQVNISDKKIEAYELERQMYVDERDKLLRTNASEEELEPYRERIAEMDSIIAAETAHKEDLQEEIAEARAYIAETNALMKELQAQIEAEYDRKEIIETFIESEKERLNRELEEIRETRQELLAEQEEVSDNLARAEQQVARLSRDMELIRNQEMSEILEMQAEISQAEADLAGEEVDLLEEAPGREMTVADVEGDTTTAELQSLSRLGNQLDSLNELIQEEKAEIARTRKELAETRARAAEQRARFGRTVGIVAIVIVVGGIALLGLFYYLGRRSRKTS